ncbi:MAG: flagellar type III secretion system pore protein FliP [Thermoguttaceae bacterium]|nr:flagellar type III secretion system pore protein FliP [Thermoguttaceae bacterium]
MKDRFLPVLLVVSLAFAALAAFAAEVSAQNYTSRTAPAPVQSQPKYKVWTNPESQPETAPEVKTELPVQGPVRAAQASTAAAQNPPVTLPEMDLSAPSLKPAQNEEIPADGPTLPAAGPTLTKEERAQKVVEELVASELEKTGGNLGGTPSGNPSEDATSKTSGNPEGKNFWDLASWVSPDGIQGSALTVLIISAVSLAPAFLMMTTSFVRIFVVLGILRHGFGTQGIPGTQVLAALALFMTFFIMFPTWEKTWNDALVPYQAGELTSKEALEKGLKPMRDFMAGQLERAGNTEEILLFWRYSSTPPDETRLAQYTADDVPLHVLLPAFMLGELKTAFLIGVQLLIPMLVIDLLVSSILVSMGMIMLPPTMVSLPFKLLLFVLADGWRLVVEMLIGSF